MRYFLYNTDRRALTEQPRPRFPVLIEKSIAACGGDYDKFGTQLGKLDVGDTLLMYENGVGVVAVGSVREEWDQVQHKTPRYYKPTELASLTGGPYEYRIPVDWHTDLRDTPIPLVRLREEFASPAFSPQGTVVRVIKHAEAVAKLVGELESLKQIPSNVVDEKPPPRVISTVYRHIRDTAVSRAVKLAHGSKCQICGSSFDLPDGSAYAEAHHIKPLGHDGPDIKTNLICVCPNHHAMLDYFVMPLNKAKLRQVAGHTIDQNFIDYHNDQVAQRRVK